MAGNVIQRNIPLGVTNDVDLYPIHSLPFRVHLLILPHHTLFLAPGKNKQQFYHQRDAFSPPQRTHLLEDRSNSRRLFLPELHGIPFPFQLLRTFLQLRESNTAVVKNSRPKVIVILAIRPCASVTSFSKYQQCGISGGTITTSPLPKGSVRSPISRMPEPTMIYDNSHVACSCRPICSPGARHTSSKVKEVFSGRGTALSFIIWVKYLPEGE